MREVLDFILKPSKPSNYLILTRSQFVYYNYSNLYSATLRRSRELKVFTRTIQFRGWRRSKVIQYIRLDMLHEET